MKFTYVGDNNHPPAEINFMGREKFKLNVAKEVTDEKVIAKLEGNPCFIKGAPKEEAPVSEDSEEDSEESSKDNTIGYHEMCKALKEADVKPENRTAEAVQVAYERLAA